MGLPRCACEDPGGGENVPQKSSCTPNRVAVGSTTALMFRFRNVRFAEDLSAYRSLADKRQDNANCSASVTLVSFFWRPSPVVAEYWAIPGRGLPRNCKRSTLV